MAVVFVVEDDDALRSELCALLDLEGFEHRVACDFGRAAEEILAAGPDCVIMDAMLPGIDGRVIARKVKAASDVPVIMLTCLDSEFDEVTALNQGADDYLTKPYRPAVLMARVHALLRRRGQGQQRLLSHGGVSLDAGSGRVSCGDRSADLTRNEVRILGAGRAAWCRARRSCASCGSPTPSWTTTP
ncbi:MAG: response regulator transcription factor [Coriobacteriia bacterium]|nr:response regulator transcription factor [Coriobacteriia bacterium]